MVFGYFLGNALDLGGKQNPKRNNLKENLNRLLNMKGCFTKDFSREYKLYLPESSNAHRYPMTLFIWPSGKGNTKKEEIWTVIVGAESRERDYNEATRKYLEVKYISNILSLTLLSQLTELYIKNTKRVNFVLCKLCNMKITLEVFENLYHDNKYQTNIEPWLVICMLKYLGWSILMSAWYFTMHQKGKMSWRMVGG